MSVDEMIEFLQGCAQVGQPEFSKIEAALRAGQEMADEVPETSYARQAWDAAMKEIKK